MKKRLSILILIVLNLSVAWAQQRAIKGKISDEKGVSILGASVIIKGTTIGNVSDSDGNYTLDISSNQTVLIISYVGYLTQEITVGVSNVVDVVLADDSKALEEFVTTALNISRSKKSLGYTIQDVKGENLTLARDANVANALAGKIAGVQVLSQSGAKFGTPNIRIRGVNTLTGGDPLYVVDGTPTDINQVNMDDVDNLSVLKGPAATALYGNRAASGVVIVTTKKAKKGESSFTLNHSTTYDVIGTLPDYQNEYGGGYSQEWETFKFNPATHPKDWKSFDGQKILTYAADESWGPKMDGSLHRSAFSWQPGAQFGQLTPFSPHPDNIRSFFEQPLSHNTSIAFEKGGENFGTRISYTHIENNGIIPNSSQGRDFISAKNSLNMTKKLSVNLNLNYTNTRTKNRPADNYGSVGGNGASDLSGIVSSTLSGFNQTIGSFNQWFERQLDIEDLKNYKNADGSFRSWNIESPTNPRPKFWDSPYTQVYENTNAYTQERLFGDVGLTYQFTDHLKASVIARQDIDTYNGEGKIAAGTLYAGGNGAFSTFTSTQKERNLEALLSFDKRFDKISLSINGGSNMRSNDTKLYLQETVGGLTTPGFYNIAASKDRPNVVNNVFKREVNSVYANASIGYNEFIYLDASARNDWSSTLPKANNSYFYPSVSMSFVFSEFLSKSSFLSYGKIRAGFAKVGTDVGPYRTATTYNTVPAFGSNPVQGIPTLLPNEDLKPGLSSSYEGGIDLKFFNNRFGIEFTAYQNDNKDQIIPVPVSSTSGYATALINAGHIQSSGIEIHLNVVPIKTQYFNWNIDLNFDRSKSKVIKLADGLTNYELGDAGWRGLTINAREGEEWGLFVGRKIQIHEGTGKRIVDEEGFYVSDLNQNLGSVLPEFKGGMVNSLSWKGLVLRFNLDFIVGGKFFSVTRMFNAYSGLAAETAGLNELGKPKRDPVADGGGILLDAVTSDGKPNTKRVDAQALYEDKLFAMHDNWIYDQTFLKLREVALGYSIPKNLLGKSPFKSLYVGLAVRNPWLIYGAVGKGIDVSEAETYWTEGGQLPSVRSFGLNVKIGF
jgi:TonB-linked SusC/RagA family outer membrane protein